MSSAMDVSLPHLTPDGAPRWVGVPSSWRQRQSSTTPVKLWSRSRPGWPRRRSHWSVSGSTRSWRCPSGLIILWQFRHRMPETRERQALRLIAFSFFTLAGYVTFESLRSLADGEAAAHSTVGIVLAGVSLIVMPFLSWAQRRTGRQLGSTTVVADSKQTLLCTYLSAVLLLGLLLNSTLGWWWADPLVGLVVAVLAVKEGRDAWRGDACACGPLRLRTPARCHCCRDLQLRRRRLPVMSGHDHSHGPSISAGGMHRKRLLIVLGVTSTVLVAELVGARGHRQSRAARGRRSHVHRCRGHPARGPGGHVRVAATDAGADLRLLPAGDPRCGRQRRAALRCPPSTSCGRRGSGGTPRRRSRAG